MTIKITDINICCDAVLDENLINTELNNDTYYQKWLEEHQDFNYEDIGIHSNLEMTDESSWLLEEIEKVKEQKHLYDTLLVGSIFVKNMLY